MTDKIEEAEQAYIRGRRSGLLEGVRSALRGLGIDEQDPLIIAARLISERERVLVALRGICTDHGDNDWPDNLDLADVIEKHLGRHLDSREPL